MLAAVDIGNSNVVVGFFYEGRWEPVWRLPTLASEDPLVYYRVQLSNQLLEAGIEPQSLKRSVLSSVVPELTPIFETVLLELTGAAPLTVNPAIYPQLDIHLNRPNEIGTDLLANAIAARKLFPSGAIVVDFGTALTFTVVDHTGGIAGVAIAPGIKTSIHALFSKTAQLPEVPLELPADPIGKNTTHAIQSGVLIGYVGLVRHLLAEIRSEIGKPLPAIGTGGLLHTLPPLHSDFEFIDRELTLNGLRIIYDRIHSVNP